MTMDGIATSLVYLVSVFSVLIFGKMIFDLVHQKIKLKKELVDRDNVAVALSLSGYFFGIVFILGGLLGEGNNYWLDDVIGILLYGLLGVVLLTFGQIINDRIILHSFDNTKEIVEDRNVGMGFIECCSYIANGLILGGALSGHGGSVLTAIVFWTVGQIALVFVCRVYEWATPFKVLDAIERDNIAVGVAFGGILVAVGNICNIAVSGDFISWYVNGFRAFSVLSIGFMLLPIVRAVTDILILPGAKLSEEITGTSHIHPNIGAGALEASSYIISSLLLGWVF